MKVMASTSRPGRIPISSISSEFGKNLMAAKDKMYFVQDGNEAGQEIKWMLPGFVERRESDLQGLPPNITWMRRSSFFPKVAPIHLQHQSPIKTPSKLPSIHPHPSYHNISFNSYCYPLFIRPPHPSPRPAPLPVLP
jgi:hypothetical protein